MTNIFKKLTSFSEIFLNCCVDLDFNHNFVQRPWEVTLYNFTGKSVWKTFVLLHCTRYSLQAVHFLWLTFCSSLYRENLHQQEVWLTDYFEGLWKPKSKLSTLYRAFTDKQCTESKPMTVVGLLASDSSVSSVLFCWGQLFLCFNSIIWLSK